MLKLKILKGPDRTGEKWTLKPGSHWIIGRSESAQIRLTKGSVSKMHCSLKVISDTEIEIEDLRSSNGTFVNGVLIKKHIAVLGDVIKVANYEIKITRHQETLNFARSKPAAGTQLTQGPLALQSNNWEIPALDANSPEISAASSEIIPAAEMTLADKADLFLAKNVYPLADSLSSKISLRWLVLISLALWSLLLVVVTAYPFMDKANERVQNQSVELAKLYGRQLVRINQRAIIEQRYSDLVGALDSKAGQTPGLVDSFILDNQKAQILAPADKLGAGLPTPWAAKVIAQERDSFYLDNQNQVHVGVPIFIGTNEGNKAVATAYVVMNLGQQSFTSAHLLDQITSSILYSLIIALFLWALLRRWVEGSLTQVSTQTHEAMRDAQSSISSPVLWPPLEKLVTEISALHAKAGASGMSGDGPQVGGFSATSWLNSLAHTLPLACGIMDADQKIVSWNPPMETITGVREAQALGVDISNASRDLAFETAIKELCSLAQQQTGNPQSKVLDFSGTDHRISVIHTGSHFIITLSLEGGH